MKNTLLIIIVLASFQGMAQLGDLKNKFTKNTEKSSEVSSEESMKLNQYEQADFIKDGTTKIYTTLWSGGRVGVSSGACKDLKYEKKDWRLEITEVKREGGKVISFTLNRSSDARTKRSYTFTPSGLNKDTDGYFTDATCWTTGKGYFVVLYGGGIYPITNDPYPTNDYCIISAYGNKSASLEELKAYTAPLVELKAQSQGQIAEAGDKERADHYAKYSIENKEVSEIKIVVNKKGGLGVWDTFTFGFEAILKDGTKIRTRNIGGEGYMSDYNYAAQGAESDMGGYKVVPQLHNNSGDYILISVSSKFKPSLKAEEKIVLDYDKGVKLFYDGGNGFTGPTAKPGMDLIVEAKAVKHTETGADLVQYAIYNLDGKLLSTVRVKPNQSLFVSSVGGRGSNGNDDNAYNGANGGNIKLLIDPSLTNYVFSYSNRGGAGGTTNNRAYRNGMAGADGNYSEKSQKVR